MSSHSDCRQQYLREPSAANGALWRDTIELLAVSDDGQSAVATRFSVVPERRCSTLQICVWLGQGNPIVLSEPALEFPERLWEVRGSGLWAEHVCETPNDHWSYGLEAFAIQIDNPTELLQRGFGDRVPLGWELEFEKTGAIDWNGDTSYAQPGRVHGILLTDAGELPFDGVGSRTHQWDAGPTAELSSVVDENPVQALDGSVALPGLDEVWWVARRDEAIVAGLTPEVL